MGCTCSSPVDRTAEEDLVGGVGRTVQQVRAGEVPQERNAMVALEVAASRHTIYRKRMRRFNPDGKLDYNVSSTFLHLRNLLDEPVGRFYLLEFAQEKKLPEMTDLVEAWVAIHRLKTHKELALQAVLDQAEEEDRNGGTSSSDRDKEIVESIFGTREESNSNGNGAPRGFIVSRTLRSARKAITGAGGGGGNGSDRSGSGKESTSDDVQGDGPTSAAAGAGSPDIRRAAEKASGDARPSGGPGQPATVPLPRELRSHDQPPLPDAGGRALTQYGYPVELPTDQEIVTWAQEILDKFLNKSSPNSLWTSVRTDVLEESLPVIQKAISARDMQNLRYHAFIPLQNAIFIRIVEGKYHQKFREHSEYKRYKLKFARCYNTISHRDFDFMATLGKGSFGRVLRVRKKTTGEQYALKVMSKKKILSGAESGEQVTIERNVLVMCDCPSIMRIEFTFQTSRALFLALELLEGGTLVDAMKANGGVLSLEQTKFIAAQMVLGLEHLHRHGVLYRDLKPVNVILDRRGNAVLTDMGLAAKFRDSQFPKEEGAVSSSGNRLVRRKSMRKLKPEELKCVGTFGYRAPEVLMVSETRAGYDEVVDYWALGVCIFYITHARLPFNKKSGRKSLLGAQLNPKEHEKRLHREPLLLPPQMDPVLLSLIEGLLTIDPNERLGRNVGDVMAHPFFEGIDWDLLAQRKLRPVYRPRVPRRSQNEKPAYAGLREAMQQFSQDNVLELFGGENEMNDEYTHVGRSQQKLFREWDYVPDDLLEPDWELCGENVMFD